jgi:hypothetical protein
MTGSATTQSTVSLRRYGLRRCARNDEVQKAGIAPGLLGFLLVLPGLVPGIHVLFRQQEKSGMAGSEAKLRRLPGHDDL